MSMAEGEAAKPDCEMIEHLAFNTKMAIGARARIGLVVLATDYTIEHEFRRIITLPGVDFYAARIRNSPSITPASLAAMEPLLRRPNRTQISDTTQWRQMGVVMRHTERRAGRDRATGRATTMPVARRPQLWVSWPHGGIRRRRGTARRRGLRSAPRPPRRGPSPAGRGR